MNNNEILVSLDIGTSEIKVIIGEVLEDSLNIIGVGTAKSNGMKKYNMGSYELVKFNLEKLKEYDYTGVEKFLDSINIGNDELDYKIKI